MHTVYIARESHLEVKHLPTGDIHLTLRRLGNPQNFTAVQWSVPVLGTLLPDSGYVC